MPAPVPSRAESLARLSRAPFDVLVVGGGVTGCGIARDAALRGLQVALVEKDDFASGTSSRSSRLVHGGLRYLEHGHLHLVFEASAERRRLLRLAPHLVRPLEFLWPVYEGARVPEWKLRAGLTLYDVLSLFRNVAPHRALTADAVVAREPALRRAGLRAGATYYDAATDDARLTLANALGAVEAGAVVVNHVELVGRRVSGVGRREGHLLRARDRVAGMEFELHARVVANATGPWSDAVRRLLEGPTPDSRPATPDDRIRGSKGVHIAVPRARIGNRGALTVLSPRDGRVMFVLPGSDDAQTIVGTTDTYTTTSPDEVRATTEDVEYLLATANALFPEARLGRDDVVSAWAGIRPLIASDGAAAGGPGGASREHAVARGAHGVVSITGGKLTTYRVMAADALEAALRSLGTRVPRGPAPTAAHPLPGGDVDVAAATAEAQAVTGDPALGRHLVRAHGSRWRAVWDEIGARPDGAERVVPELPYTLGELRHAVRQEMAVTLGDLLIRRTHLAFESRDHGVRAAPRAAAAVAAPLGWTDLDARVRDYSEEVERMFGVDPPSS